MANLLVSVQNALEFQQVARAGVPWIDFKDPTRGALGRPKLNDVLSAIDGHDSPKNVGTTLSVALGEASEWNPTSTSFTTRDPSIAKSLIQQLTNEISVDRQQRANPIGGVVKHFKIGLSGWQNDPAWMADWWLSSSEGLASSNAELIPVYYADLEIARSPDFCAILRLARQSGSKHVLIDTFNKRKGRLFSWLKSSDLSQFVADAHTDGMKIAVAGSIRWEELDQAEAAAPDIIAVRSMVCKGLNRHGPLDRARLEALVQRLSPIDQADSL